MKLMREITRGLISFIMMFLVIGLVLSLFCSTVLINADFINKHLEKGNYYQELSKDLKLNYQNFSMVTSIPEELLMGLMTEKEMKAFSTASIRAAVDYMKYERKDFSHKINETAFHENLNGYIEKYAVENNIEVDKILQSQVDTIAQDLKASTESHLTLFNISKVADYPQFQKLRKILHLADGSTFFILMDLVVLIGLLTFHCRRRIYRTFLWIGSSLVAGSMFLIIPAGLALFLKIPQKISISDDYINEAIRSLTSGYFQYFLKAGIIVLLVGMVCFYIYTTLSNRAVIKRISHNQQAL